MYANSPEAIVLRGCLHQGVALLQLTSVLHRSRNTVWF